MTYGFISEIRLRSAAYAYGLGEFAENAWINLQNGVRSEREEPRSPDLSNKTCLITGGNVGIGFAVAFELLQRGCAVWLACRNLEKANKAAQDLKAMAAAAGISDAVIRVVEVALDSLESVRQFCNTFTASREELDMLILNAGIMGSNSKRKITDDGFEEHFQVNYLSHWLIAHELTGAYKLRRQEQHNRSKLFRPLRVVFLTSSTHLAGKLEIADLQLDKSEFSSFQAYTNSKLANILAAKQLQTYFDRDPGCDGCAAVAVHPGLVQTNLAHGWFKGEDVFLGVLQPLTAAVLSLLAPAILQPASRAAQTVLFAALAPASQVKGEYVAYGKVRRPSHRALDMKLAAQLWDKSLELTRTKRNLVDS